MTSDLKAAIATLPSSPSESDSEAQAAEHLHEVREPSRFRYDAQKALSKHRIRGPMDFGFMIDTMAVSKCQLSDPTRAPKSTRAPSAAAPTYAFQIRRVPVKMFGLDM